MWRSTRNGFTLVELVIVMVVSGILFIATPPLVLYGVKTLVFLPNALAVNQATQEIMHQVIEGGFTTLAGQSTIRGLRCAVRRSAGEPALWFAQGTSLGFLNSDGQRVVIRLDNGIIKRRLRPDATCPPPAPLPNEEEFIPYYAQGITVTGFSFQYYNQGGVVVPVPAPCDAPTLASIRRVDVTLTAQTGNGVFDQGNAQEQATSSVAIRIP